MSGTTPSSVPTFKPRSTKRTLLEAAKIRPCVKQADRVSLSSKAYDALHESATEGLSTKFQLMTSTKNNDEKLVGTYTLNIILKYFIHKLKIFDLQNAFTLIQPDPSNTDGSVLPETIPLLEHYDRHSLQKHVIE